MEEVLIPEHDNLPIGPFVIGTDSWCAFPPFSPSILADSSESGEIAGRKLKGPASRTRIWVDDVNSDGKLDILVGDTAPLISPANKVTEEEFKKRFADWNKSVGEAAKELNAAANDSKKQNEAQQRYQNIYNQRSEFMTEDRTGFVWLYLRK
jgi:hypothetical protein